VKGRKASEIIQILLRTIDLSNSVKAARNSFETLIATIISQNTNDRNTEKAFSYLSKQFEIKPEVLAKAETSQLEACLRVGGLYKNKAKTIKQVSGIIVEKFHGSLDCVLSLPFEESRNELISLPGIGPKTADVVLLFAAGQPTIPVDTHVNRVAKRLGFAPETGDYEAVRMSLQSLYEQSEYLDVHVVLIAHGRKHCKARRPLCELCPVKMHCPSRGLCD